MKGEGDGGRGKTEEGSADLLCALLEEPGRQRHCKRPFRVAEDGDREAGPEFPELWVAPERRPSGQVLHLSIKQLSTAAARGTRSGGRG